jgi:hypothetical protein
LPLHWGGLLELMASVASVVHTDIGPAGLRESSRAIDLGFPIAANADAAAPDNFRKSCLVCSLTDSASRECFEAILLEVDVGTAAGRFCPAVPGLELATGPLPLLTSVQDGPSPSRYNSS